jgi:hypothetical protein
MAFKLFESAQRRWEPVKAPKLVGQVRDSGRVDKTELVGRIG